jgi:hypothetical protein
MRRRTDKAFPSIEIGRARVGGGRPAQRVEKPSINCPEPPAASRFDRPTRPHAPASAMRQRIRRAWLFRHWRDPMRSRAYEKRSRRSSASLRRLLARASGNLTKKPATGAGRFSARGFFGSGRTRPKVYAARSEAPNGRAIKRGRSSRAISAEERSGPVRRIRNSHSEKPQVERFSASTALSVPARRV